uniref:Uncharacterized protein n=1 Tax=Canis lupus familiaris TaxID=9615 RepID=A0A8C0PXV6_CANLF
MDMLTEDPITTCLSPSVYDMICQLKFEVRENCDTNSIVTQRDEVCWKTITDSGIYIGSGQGLHYRESLRLLGPVCKAGPLTFVISDQGWKVFAELFLEIFDALESLQSPAISLSLMKLTAYLSQNHVFQGCPFLLLRDLFASKQLARVFGQSVVEKSSLDLYVDSTYITSYGMGLHPIKKSLRTTVQ